MVEEQNHCPKLCYVKIKEFVVTYSSDPKVKELSGRQDLPLTVPERTSIQDALYSIMINYRDSIAAKYGRLYEIPTNRAAFVKLRREITDMPEFDTIAKAHHNFSIPAADGDVKHSDAREEAADCTEDGTEVPSGLSSISTTDKKNYYFRPISPDHQSLDVNCKQEVKAVKPIKKTPKRQRRTKSKNSKTNKQMRESRSEKPPGSDFDSFMTKARKILSYRPLEDEVSSKAIEKPLYNSPGDIGDKTSVMDMIVAVLNDKPSEVQDIPSATIPTIYVSHDLPFIAKTRELRKMQLIEDIKTSIADACEENRITDANTTNDSISRIPEGYTQKFVPSLEAEENEECISKDPRPQMISDLYEKDPEVGSLLNPQSSLRDHAVDPYNQRGVESSYFGGKTFHQQFTFFVDKLTSVIRANMEKSVKGQEAALSTSDISTADNAGKFKVEAATLADMIIENFQKNRDMVKPSNLKLCRDFEDMHQDSKKVQETSLIKSPSDVGYEESVMDMIAAVMNNTPSKVQDVKTSAYSSEIIVSHLVSSTAELPELEELETIEDMKTFLASLPDRNVLVDISTTEVNIPQPQEEHNEESFETLKELIRQERLAQGMRPQFIGDLYITKLAKARLIAKEMKYRKREPRVKNKKPVYLDTDLMYAVRQSVKRYLPMFTGKNNIAGMMLMADGIFQEMSLDRELDDLSWPYDPLADLKESGLALVDYMDPTYTETFWKHSTKDRFVNISETLKGKSLAGEDNLDIGEIDQELCSGVTERKPSSNLDLDQVLFKEKDMVHENGQHDGTSEVSDDDDKMRSADLNKSFSSTVDHPSPNDKDNTRKDARHRGVEYLNICENDRERCLLVSEKHFSNTLDQVSVAGKSISQKDEQHDGMEDLEDCEDDQKMYTEGLNGSSCSTWNHPALVNKHAIREDVICGGMECHNVCENDGEVGSFVSEGQFGSTRDQVSVANKNTSQIDEQNNRTEIMEVCEDDQKMFTDGLNGSPRSTWDHPPIVNKHATREDVILGGMEYLNVSENDGEMSSVVSDGHYGSTLDHVSVADKNISMKDEHHDGMEDLEVCEDDQKDERVGTVSIDFQSTTFQQQINTLADKLISVMKANMNTLKTCPRILQTESDDQGSKTEKEFPTLNGLTSESCMHSRQSPDRNVCKTDQKRCAVVLENKSESSCDQLVVDEDIQEYDSFDEPEIIPSNQGGVVTIDFSSQFDHQLANFVETIISVMRKNLHNEPRQGDWETLNASDSSRCSLTDTTGNKFEEDRGTLIDMIMETYLKECGTDQSFVDAQASNLGEQKDAVSPINSMIFQGLDQEKILTKQRIPAENMSETRRGEEQKLFAGIDQQIALSRSDTEDNKLNAYVSINSYEQELGHDADQRKSFPDSLVRSSNHELNHLSVPETERTLVNDRDSEVSITQDDQRSPAFSPVARHDEETALEDEDQISAKVASEDSAIGQDESTTSTLYASSSIASGSSSYEDDPSSQGLMYKINFFNSQASATPIITPTIAKPVAQTALVTSKVNLFEELSIQERHGITVSSGGDIAMDPLRSKEGAPRINGHFEGSSNTIEAKHAQHVEKASHAKAPTNVLDIKNKVKLFQAMRNENSSVEKNLIKKRNRKIGGGKFAMSRVAFFEQFNKP